MTEKKDGGTTYLENAIEAIPTHNFFYQIALLRWMLKITEASHAFEVAEQPDSPPQLPIDPHGFPPIPHMLGSVQFAIERYKAEQTFRKQKAQALLDTMMTAQPAVITAAAKSLQAGQFAEQRLIGLIADLKPESHAYIETLRPNKRDMQRLPITMDQNFPTLLQTLNTPSPFNNPSRPIQYPGYDAAYSDWYASSPSARAMMRYLPPLGVDKPVGRDSLTAKMSKGALLVLRGQSTASSESTNPFLHLFNAEADLRVFNHPKITSEDHRHYIHDLDSPSTSADYRRFPLFELVQNLAPELVERLALVDLRDITSEEQLKFYTALDTINKLCNEIGKKFDLYVAQTLSDQDMTTFLTATVAKTLESVFASLENERLKNELNVGYASVMTRMRTEKGLIKTTPVKLMHIQSPPADNKKRIGQSGGAGNWLKRTFLGS